MSDRRSVPLTLDGVEVGTIEIETSSDGNTYGVGDIVVTDSALSKVLMSKQNPLIKNENFSIGEPSNGE